ncbi:centromere protein I [Rhinophrynus dorsalis]
MEEQRSRRSLQGDVMKKQIPDIKHLEEALQYFKTVNSKVPLKGNIVLHQHLSAVETFGKQNGIPPDGINILLNQALSGNLADAVSTRLLKCMLPSSEVTQSTIIQAVSLFCLGKCSSNTQILFIRWLITVFDLITCKDVLSSLYNFFFCFLHNSKLCPYLCHLLYLLTKKDHVRPFRIRKLLELQSKNGLQPPLLGLLSIYKIFCPELVSLTLPNRFKTYFKSSHLLWRSELRDITRRNAGDPAGDCWLSPGSNGQPQTLSRKRFRERWEQVLDTCSQDLMKLLVEYDKGVLSKLEVEIKNVTEKLREFESLESFKTGYKKMNEDMEKFEMVIIERKKRKLLRDLNDYREGGKVGIDDMVLELNILKKGSSDAVISTKKWNCNPSPPVSSSVWDRGHITADKMMTDDQTLPVEKLQTFTQLLENIHRLELPAQMGSVLKNPLLLHYMNCIKDDTPFLRLNYWLAFTLHEECAWYKGNKRSKEEVEAFLGTVVNTQQFLQEGLSSSEGFLYKSLPHWNGSHRSQVLKLISWIPLSSSTEMEALLYEPLARLFITSSVYFKCSVLESLKDLLQNWLIWHSVCTERVHMQSINMDSTMSGLLTSVKDLINFTGRLSTLGLQIESCPLLLHFILNFYDLVSDMYVRFSLPLVVLPPPGVFYPALLSTESVNLNQLCYVMYRYRTSLETAKMNERQKKTQMHLSINSQTYQEFNKYLTAMVGCLWTSQAFHQDTHPQGIQMTPDLLERSGVPYYKKAFNIVYHPALMGYSSSFLLQRFSEDDMFQLQLIKGQLWNNYLDFLYTQGLDGFKLFFESSVNRLATNSQQQEPRDLHPSQA